MRVSRRRARRGGRLGRDGAGRALLGRALRGLRRRLVGGRGRQHGTVLAVEGGGCRRRRERRSTPATAGRTAVELGAAGRGALGLAHRADLLLEPLGEASGEVRLRTVWGRYSARSVAGAAGIGGRVGAVLLDASSPVSRGCVCSVGRSVIRPHSRVGNRPSSRSHRLLHRSPHRAIPASRRAGALGVGRRSSSVVVDSPSSSPVSSAVSSASGASTERATTATASPSLGVTNFTPIVERPVGPEVVVDRAAHDLAALGDREHLVAVDDDEGADQVAALLVGQRHRLDAEAAARLQAVVGDPRALGEAAVGDGEDVLRLDRGPLLGRDLLGPDHRHRQHRVARLRNFMPGDAGRRPAHRPQLGVVGAEPDRLALAGDQQDVVVGLDQLGADQLVVVLAEVDGDHAGLARAVVVAEAGLLDQAVAGGEHEVGSLLVVADRQHLRDVLVGLERQQAGDVAALGVALGLGQVVGLGAVDPAGRGEEQQPVVVGRRDEVLDDVVAAQARAAHALAAALLGAVLVGAGALGVAAAGDRDDELLVGDQVLHREVAVGRDDLAYAGRRRTSARSRPARR